MYGRSENNKTRAITAPQRNKTLTVVVPVHNESQNLSLVAQTLARHLDELDCASDILFVDDGSTDATWERICELNTGTHGRVQGVKLSRNFGKEAALLAGLSQVSSDAAITIDGDLQHPPEKMVEFVRAWQAGAKVVDGVKKQRGDESLFYRVCAALFYFLVWLFTSQRLRGSSDFKLLDRQAFEALRQFEERRFFFRAAVASLGFAHVEVGFDVAPRAGGHASYSWRKLLRLVVVALSSSPTAPIRIVSFTGLAFLVLALVLGSLALYQKFTGVAVEGFTTVILLLLIVGGMVMLGLGTLGEYVAATLEEVRRRPRFIVQDARLGTQPQAHSDNVGVVSLTEMS